jgi:hypothetical protein
VGEPLPAVMGIHGASAFTPTVHFSAMSADQVSYRVSRLFDVIERRDDYRFLLDHFTDQILENLVKNGNSADLDDVMGRHLSGKFPEDKMPAAKDWLRNTLKAICKDDAK